MNNAIALKWSCTRYSAQHGAARRAQHISRTQSSWVEERRDGHGWMDVSIKRTLQHSFMHNVPYVSYMYMKGSAWPPPSMCVCVWVHCALTMCVNSLLDTITVEKWCNLVAQLFDFIAHNNFAGAYITYTVLCGIKKPTLLFGRTVSMPMHNLYTQHVVRRQKMKVSAAIFVGRNGARRRQDVFRPPSPKRNGHVLKSVKYLGRIGRRATT